MYFTFPSFKNIATQRSFNEIIHFPLHCLKSTFRFRNPAESLKNDFGAIFSIVIKVYFSPSDILQKVQIKRFWGDFFNFQQNFQNPFFPSEILQKVRKNHFWAIFSIFSKFSKVHFFPSKILQKVRKNDF